MICLDPWVSNNIWHLPAQILPFFDCLELLLSTFHLFSQNRPSHETVIYGFFQLPILVPIPALSYPYVLCSEMCSFLELTALF